MKVAPRAAGFADLNRRLQPLLEPTLAAHVTFAGIRDGRALFLADSSAWASRARYQQLHLRRHLLALDQPVHSIDVKVIQPERTERAARNSKPLTPASSKHLRAAAASTSDPELRACYLAMASLSDTTPD